MALLAKHRASIYTKLSPVIGDEETEALLAQFPSRDDEEPITKHYLRAEINKLEGSLRSDMAKLAGDLRGEMKDMRAELKEDIADVRAEVGGLRTELHQVIRRQTIWVTSVGVGFLIAATTIGNALN